MYRVARLNFAATTLLLIIISGCADSQFRATSRFDYRDHWHDFRQLQVVNHNGRITVEPHDQDHLTITGECYARGISRAEAQRRLDRIEITHGPSPDDPSVYRIETGSRDARWRRMGAEMTVRVPASWQPLADNAAPSDGFAVSLKSSNGRLSVQDLPGGVQAKTSNGRISVSSVDGPCRLRSSNGRIEATGIRGSVYARTSNGRIIIDATPPADGTVTARSSNGRIDLHLPDSLRGSVLLETSNGRVETDMPDLPLRDIRADRDHFSARIGAGPAQVTAETSNGSIRLRLH